MPLRGGARLWWGLPVLLVVLWMAGALALQAFPGLPQPPEITLVALPVARFARDVSAVLAVGALVVGGLLTMRGERGHERLLGWATEWAIAWLCSLLVLLVLTTSDVFASGISDLLDPGAAWTFLIDNTVGRVILVQLIATALIAALAWRARSRSEVWLLALIAVAASAAPSFLGHSGMPVAHAAATISLGLHIAAVSVWVGGLAVVVLLAAVDRSAAIRVLPAFSLVALWCVVITAETGLLNATLRVGTAVALVGTLYGTLVLGKGVLLGYLVRLGWLQRSRVVPDLDALPDPGMRAFARIAGYEVVLMGVAIGVSVALSRIGPGTPVLTAQRFTPLAMVLVAVAIPLLIAWSTPRPSARWLVRLRSLPELAAVLLLVVTAEVTALGLLGSVLGSQVGTVLGSLLIVAAGWLWAVCPSASSIAIVMAGWPAIMWLASSTATIPAGAKANVVALVLAEAILAAWLWRTVARRPARELETTTAS